jgi:hypothetical protein
MGQALAQSNVLVPCGRVVKSRVKNLQFSRPPGSVCLILVRDHDLSDFKRFSAVWEIVKLLQPVESCYLAQS